MAERKAISKKIRFDVFKRDSFQCQYCGHFPPKVILEIDHVHPVSKGGTNDIDNLLTACFDCNRGKSDGLISSAPLSVADKTAALIEKQEQLKAYENLLKAIKRKKNKNINLVEQAFQETFEDRQFTGTFKSSIERFLSDLPLSEVIEAMHKACSKCDEPTMAIKYFCGICWNKIKGTGYGAR
jgi:CRISPR/Cas system Type II protein with McrA/HNH and RuvC-like nuclease domain